MVLIAAAFTVARYRIAKSGTTRPPLVQLTFSAPSAPVGGAKLPYLPDCPAFE
ncbi:hypothetical protein MGG_17167 [Pyricularia oryzae 70-15]|uniref:Uncharacterized protein n=3 Tax=Pyricularia oryzae TaxID=318829 RepID=G4N6D3_PYRO7|nr:uncharacterized protein MGG_17167 [Pyricularia oryzae 70-15]EHA50655.1 hypothetical protein MGG_17167 [Pyricularia oryzae 70-15]ELQ44860.1 hypothetical protein OOU_Y34scaffold00037g2 [Pyricularia oryzae Y34]